MVIALKRTTYVYVALLGVILFINICEPIKNINLLFYSSFAMLAIKWLFSPKKIHTKWEFLYFVLLGGMILLPRFFSDEFGMGRASILKYEAYLFLLLFITYIDLSKINILGIIVGVGCIHTIATYIFLILPSEVYRTYAMFFYGYYPQGTNMGTKGYTAALNSHYSANAQYCIVIVIAIWSMIWNKGFKDKKKIYVYWILAMGALLLTEKRAHLVFGVMAIIITYYIYNRNRLPKIIPKVVLGAIITVPILILGVLLVPSLFNVFTRFVGVFAGKDISNGRFALWKTAFTFFESNPIRGIGWQNFMPEAKVYFNVHNIYLQILCETGIIGFVILIIFLVTNYKKVVRVYKQNQFNEILSNRQQQIVFSVCYQIFFILYGMTGNGLYDNTLFFYCLSVGMGLSAIRNLAVNDTRDS